MAKEADSVWETRFAELQAFRKRFGHCRVPLDWPHNKPLAKWVLIQQNRSGQLSLDQLRQLHAIGFPFGRLEQQWLNGFFDLADWYQTRGSQDRATRFIKDNQLQNWVGVQRLMKRSEKITPDHQRRLDQLGFEWTPRQSQWEIRLRQAQALKELHGHCRWWKIQMPAALRHWIWSIRSNHHTLSEQRLQELQPLGLPGSAEENRQEFWEQNFAALVQFKEEQGHCDVPPRWPKNPPLATWVLNLRAYKKQGRPLTTSQISRLNQLGFTWTPRDDNMSKHLADLAEFKRQYGHCNVPQRWPGIPGLGVWVNKMRFRRSRLPQSLIIELDRLQFIWDPLTVARWDQRFQELVDYKSQFGHCNVPQSQKGHLKKLAAWVNTQRTRRRHLSAERLRRLNEIGFQWNTLTQRWQDRYEQLKLFRQEHGHCRVPSGWPANPVLATWVTSLRTYRKSGQLTPDKIKLLDEIGFVWSSRNDPAKKTLREAAPITVPWETNFAALQIFQKQFGHCRVPRDWPGQGRLGQWVALQRGNASQLSVVQLRQLRDLGFSFGELEDRWLSRFFRLSDLAAQSGSFEVALKNQPALRFWLSEQRGFQRRKALPLDRYQRLTKLGMEWEPKESAWQRHLSELREIVQIHGHCNFRLLPGRISSELINWVDSVRQRHNQLSPERIRELNELGFIWKRDDYWDQQFQALRAYRDQFGDCNVPARWPHNPRLAQWVALQRAKGTGLSPERRSRLQEIGFCFSLYDTAWDCHFQELITYFKVHGHFKVSKKTHRVLGQWISMQRQEKKLGLLSPQRVQALEALGFVWTPKMARWEAMYAELCAFQKANGHINAPVRSKLYFWLNNQRYSQKSPEKIQRLASIGVKMFSHRDSRHR